MLSDDVATELEEAAEACNAAREALEEALAAAEDAGSPDEEAVLRPVASALEDWRDAQRRFMAAVDASEVDDVSTAAMLLKTNRGVDVTNARRGLPGVHVDGTDQPFDVDLTGTRGTVLTNAAMHHVTPPEN